MEPVPDRLILTRPDDWHLHLRDGEALRSLVPASARWAKRAIVMPNLKPPVATTTDALAYRDRILIAASGTDFSPLMTLYLTDRTPPAEIDAAKASGVVFGVKLYPAGATTHSDAGVTDLDKVHPTLARMERLGMPLLVHGEVTDADVDIFDRERVFLDRVLGPLLERHPGLPVVLEHVTTKEAVAFVEEARQGVGATITAQHLLANRNAMLVGGIRPHLYCLPILKREEDRQALLRAATGGNPRFFLGTDSAPHAVPTKETSCGCAGCFTALTALELYATAFEEARALERLEAFASFHGPDFYGLPRNDEQITLERTPFEVPMTLPLGASEVRPFWAGQALGWRLGCSE